MLKTYDLLLKNVAYEHTLKPPFLLQGPQKTSERKTRVQPCGGLGMATKYLTTILCQRLV